MKNLKNRLVLASIVFMQGVSLMGMNQPDFRLLSGVMNNDIAETQAAIRAGADLNVIDPENADSSALILAIEFNNNDIAQILIDAGADLNIVNRYGKNALSLAIEFQLLPIIQAMFNSGRLHQDIIDAEVNKLDQLAALPAGLTEEQFAMYIILSPAQLW